MNFVADLVGSLAWPVAAVLIAWRLRHSLSKLLSGDVRRWKAGPSGVEVEYWEERLEVIREEVRPESLLPTRGAEGVQVRADEDELQQLVAASPRAAIMEAYARIGEELRTRLVDRGLIPQEVTGGALVQLAVERGIISKETSHSIEGLRVLRNLATHGRERDIDERRALEFISLASAILYSIRSGDSHS